MDLDEIFLSIMTFNIWGLPGWIAKNKEERVNAIGSVLKNMQNVDVICLQEVWIESDYQLIKNALQGTMPYSHYFYSGVTGSGVCVFTKWPIMEILFHQWPLNGYIHMIHHGDWFGGKGVGLVTLNVKGYRVNVYTTHLHAQYHLEDSYLAHRVEQAFDTAMFIRLTSANAHFSALAGDFNTVPGSLCEKLLVHVAGLSDSYIAHDEESSIGTNDCVRNSYSNPNLVSSNPDGLRIDYILFKCSEKVRSKVLTYKFPLEKRIPGKNFSYSDHEAVLAEFQLNYSSQSGTSHTADTKYLKQVLTEGITTCKNALDDINKKSTFYWAIAILLLTLLLTPLAFEFPLLHSSIYFIISIIMCLLLIFFVLMASLWCKLEFNGILGVRDRMVVLFDSLK